MTRSLEERVNTVYRKLLLIRAAVNVADEAGLDPEMLADALNEAADEALADIMPLCHNLPAAIANYKPKDGAD